MSIQADLSKPEVCESIHAALALGVHYCLLLFPEIAIQSCSIKQAEGFLDFKK